MVLFDAPLKLCVDADGLIPLAEDGREGGMALNQPARIGTRALEMLEALTIRVP